MRVYFTPAGSEESNLQTSEPQTKAKGAIYIILLVYLWHFYVHSKQGERGIGKSRERGKCQELLTPLTMTNVFAKH